MTDESFIGLFIIKKANLRYIVAIDNQYKTSRLWWIARTKRPGFGGSPGQNVPALVDTRDKTSRLWWADPCEHPKNGG
jgi:hypothetical protein